MNNSDYEEWKNIHQPWELKYHQNSNFRWPGSESIWNEQWDNVFSLFGKLTKDLFNKQSILIDIGCGSRPALKWFNSGYIYNIDPLLSDYLKIPQLSPHWSNFDDKQLISDPAEKFQNQLKNKADFILCWNVLDHTFDHETILENCANYAKKGSLFLLGTDLGAKKHLGHPGIPNREKFIDRLDSDFETLEYSRAGFKRSRTDSFLLRRK